MSKIDKIDKMIEDAKKMTDQEIIDNWSNISKKVTDAMSDMAKSIKRNLNDQDG